MEPSESNLTEAQSSIVKWWQGARLQERGQHLTDIILSEQQLNAEPWSIQCNTELSTKKLGLWKKEAGLRTDQRLLQRLQSINLNTGAFQYLLGERSEALAQRMSTAKPIWQTELETIYFNPANQIRDETNTILLPSDEEQVSYFDLLELTRPLLTHSRRQLATTIHTMACWNHEECQRLAAEASRSLALQFIRMILRTLLHELKQRRVNDKLSGQDASARYRYFIEQLSRPESALDLLSNYPVLARQLLNRIRQWQLINHEFFSRLAQDISLLQDTFNRGQALGALLQIDAGRGDRHQDGRSVFVLSFSNNLKLLYKPKPLAIDYQFQQFLQWLNEMGVEPKLPQMNILDRIEYGWCEFITHKECQNREQVKRFYQRQGAFLAVLGMLEATDFHYENIIAHGEMPYLIDLETLFQPHLADSTSVGPGSRITLPTVMRNAMLPNFQIKSSESPLVDLSGLGNSHDRPTQAAILRDIGLDTLHQEVISSSLPSGMNQPLLDGKPALVTDYAEEVLCGYAKTYRLLLTHKELLLSEASPLAQFSGLRIRFIIRGTEIYVRLLHALYHPDHLRDGLLQDRLFDKLWLDYDYYPAVRSLIQSEHNALARSDVPLFTTTTTSHAIVSDTGQVFNDFFPLTGMEQSLLRLRHMNSSDLARQYRIIRDNLTCLARRDWSVPIKVDTPLEQVTTADLIDTVKVTARRIREQACQQNGYIGWIQPNYQGNFSWALTPTTVGLYDGLCGIALFYAAMFHTLGDQEARELAEQVWFTARCRIQDNPRALECVGAFTGWGGVFYTAAYLARWGLARPNQDELSLWYQRLRRDLPSDKDFDFIAGAAGAIMGLLRWHEYSGDSEALQLAQACADYLLSHAHPHSGGLAWPCRVAKDVEMTGLAHGAAGIAHALIVLGQYSNQAQYSEAGGAALIFENTCFSDTHCNWQDRRKTDPDDENSYVVAWCHGAPGIGLSRLSLYQHSKDPMLRADLEAAVATTCATQFGYNQSLCHGDFGNLELVERAANILKREDLHEFVQQQLRWLIPLLRENRQRSGMQVNAEVYSFMNGAAGMAYALLRIAFPQRLPSVLSLD